MPKYTYFQKKKNKGSITKLSVKLTKVNAISSGRLAIMIPVKIDHKDGSYHYESRSIIEKHEKGYRCMLCYTPVKPIINDKYEDKELWINTVSEAIHRLKKFNPYTRKEEYFCQRG